MNCSDPSGIRRAANHISWYADGARKLAVSYCNLEFQSSNSDSFIDSYIWDIGNEKVHSLMNIRFFNYNFV